MKGPGNEFIYRIDHLFWVRQRLTMTSLVRMYFGFGLQLTGPPL